MSSAHTVSRTVSSALHAHWRRSVWVPFAACLLAATVAHAQGPWTVTVTPTMNPLPIGFCAAVQLAVLDPSTKDVPRNANGSRVTMADFDMTVSGASVAGQQIDSTHFVACGCQGGSAGSTATVTASYPAKALTTAPLVPAFQRTATFTLAPAKGTVNPPACANRSASSSAQTSTVAAPPQSPSTVIALPSTSPRATVTPAPVPAPVPTPAPTPAPATTAATASPLPIAPVTVAPTPPLDPRTATPLALPPAAPRARLDTYKPGPVTVSLAMSATGSWYEPGPVTVNLSLSAQGSWYEPGPVTVTFDLSATGNWDERLQSAPPPIQQALPGP
jgi:hypothetical protein